MTSILGCKITDLTTYSMQLQKCSAQWDPQAQSTALRALPLPHACPTWGIHETVVSVWTTFRCFRNSCRSSSVCHLTVEPAEFVEIEDSRVLQIQNVLGPWSVLGQPLPLLVMRPVLQVYSKILQKESLTSKECKKKRAGGRKKKKKRDENRRSK